MRRRACRASSPTSPTRKRPAEEAGVDVGDASADDEVGNSSGAPSLAERKLAAAKRRQRKGLYEGLGHSNNNGSVSVSLPRPCVHILTRQNPRNEPAIRAFLANLGVAMETVQLHCLGGRGPACKADAILSIMGSGEAPGWEEEGEVIRGSVMSSPANKAGLGEEKQEGDEGTQPEKEERERGDVSSENGEERVAGAQVREAGLKEEEGDHPNRSICGAGRGGDGSRVVGLFVDDSVAELLDERLARKANLYRVLFSSTKYSVRCRD